MSKRTIAVLFACVLCCSIAYGRRIAWRANEEPPVSLRLALALADAELKDEKVEYFCVGASLARTFSEGDWELHFSSAEGKQMWVSVGSDKQVRKTPDGFEY